MAFKLAELFVDIKAKTTRFEAGMSKVRASINTASANMDKMKAGFRRAFLAVGSAVTATTVLFVRFESRMARVRGLTGATEIEFDKLSRFAREMGRSTVFSATQAADAMAEFALQGFRTKQIMGALPATLNLAAAGQLGMAEAATITAGVMRGMGLTVSELTRVTDVLTQAMTTSSTNLVELGAAMKKLGPVGKASNQSLESLTATLQVLANVQLRGSVGGVALRNILLKLQAPSKSADKILKSLGVSLIGTNKKMVPLSVAIDRLKAGFKNLGEAQKTAFAAELVGVRATAGLLALLDQGGSAIEKFELSLIGSAGAARRLADIQRNTLAGSFKLLTSAAKEFGLQLGEAIAPQVRQISDDMRGLIDRLNNMTTAQKAFGISIAKSIAVVSSLGLALGVTLKALRLFATFISTTLVAEIAIGVAAIVVMKAKVDSLLATIRKPVAASPLPKLIDDSTLVDDKKALAAKEVNLAVLKKFVAQRERVLIELSKQSADEVRRKAPGRLTAALKTSRKVEGTQKALTEARRQIAVIEKQIEVIKKLQKLRAKKQASIIPLIPDTILKQRRKMQESFLTGVDLAIARARDQADAFREAAKEEINDKKQLAAELLRIDKFLARKEKEIRRQDREEKEKERKDERDALRRERESKAKTVSDIVTSLRIRLARAQGDNKKAEAIRVAAEKESLLTRLKKAGASADQLALLQKTFKAEADKAKIPAAAGKGGPGIIKTDLSSLANSIQELAFNSGKQKEERDKRNAEKRDKDRNNILKSIDKSIANGVGIQVV